VQSYQPRPRRNVPTFHTPAGASYPSDGTGSPGAALQLHPHSIRAKGAKTLAPSPCTGKAAVNGWSTVEQKTALVGPASEVLRDLDTSQPQAYCLIWEALTRRFRSLGGAREATRRFDSRHQDENETIQDFEQAIRTLHREAWPTATLEQRDAALKRRFEDGLLYMPAPTCQRPRLPGHGRKSAPVHGGKRARSEQEEG